MRLTKGGEEMVLIDGDRLADSIHRELCGHITCNNCPFRTEDGGCGVEVWLDSAPVVEPKQGEWIDRTRYKGFPDYECSVCTAHGQAWMNYCPSCGARMKGEDDV